MAKRKLTHSTDYKIQFSIDTLWNILVWFDISYSYSDFSSWNQFKSNFALSQLVLSFFFYLPLQVSPSLSLCLFSYHFPCTNCWRKTITDRLHHVHNGLRCLPLWPNCRLQMIKFSFSKWQFYILVVTHTRIQCSCLPLTDSFWQLLQIFVAEIRHSFRESCHARLSLSAGRESI